MPYKKNKKGCNGRNGRKGRKRTPRGRTNTTNTTGQLLVATLNDTANPIVQLQEQLCDLLKNYIPRAMAAYEAHQDPEKRFRCTIKRKLGQVLVLSATFYHSSKDTTGMTISFSELDDMIAVPENGSSIITVPAPVGLGSCLSNDLITSIQGTAGDTKFIIGVC